MHENKGFADYAVLVAVDKGEYDAEISFAELKELAASAGIETVAMVVQKRDSTDRATCVGTGKLEEIKELVAASGDINLLIFDQELSATQLRNIEEICDIEVIDRTMLILEIFAQHANSHEGRLQVELAQHQYLLPRLSGLGKNLSRLGGGGGGGAGARRGKGETKLELDRRHIRGRIQSLKDQLDTLEQHRELIRTRRKKDGITSVAIVGYTNVGKSSLLNALTDAGVLCEDKLFATLDPTARALLLPDGRSVMLIDTVGLVRRLPHHLVQAFKSTLEEALYADLLINVCDISNSEADEQISVTNNLLADLGAQNTPMINVLNKCDLLETQPLGFSANSVLVSAKTGMGLDTLLKKISQTLPQTQRRLNLLIPYTQGGVLAKIRNEGKVFSEEYEQDGTIVDVLVDYKLLGEVEEFMI